MLKKTEQLAMREGDLFFVTVPRWDPDRSELDTTCYVVLGVTTDELTFCKTGTPYAEPELDTDDVLLPASAFRRVHCEKIVDHESWFRDREASRAWAIQGALDYIARSAKTLDDFSARRMKNRTTEARREEAAS